MGWGKAMASTYKYCVYIRTIVNNKAIITYFCGSESRVQTSINRVGD